VEELKVRLLPFEINDGPTNMAADEALLASAARGVASLRFYGWDRTTLSLGYFQAESDLLADPQLAELPFVRRPTGGLAIIHHPHELTYALAIPAARPWKAERNWLRMHEILSAALADHGVTTVLFNPEGEVSSPHLLCFHHFTAGDLMIGWDKVAGSAQRKLRGALLQHGSVLLERPPFIQSLIGIRELTLLAIEPALLASSVVCHLEEDLGWQIEPGAWTSEEREAITSLAAIRYRSDAWNRKR